ncbi:MAG: hypothetical protein HY329_05055 [Chloroflexi bacterium]|nr:hypothetical protein [Chloroflexota bacterium]
MLQHAIVDAYRRRGVERKHVDLGTVEEPAIEPEAEAALCECFAELIPTLKPEYAELLRREVPS